MSSVELIACPACGSPLGAAPVRWRVLTCGACGGVWADRDATERIMSAFDPSLVLVGRRAAKGAADNVEIELTGRRCPDCQASLRREKVAEVSLDRCDGHGTWFDRDELGRVTRNLDYERKSISPPESTDSTLKESSAELVGKLLPD